MNGTFAVDLGGARPKVSGKIVADKLDADPYIGMQPVAPKPSAQQPKPQGAKPAAGFDTAKEQRYQAWKAGQGK